MDKLPAEHEQTEFPSEEEDEHEQTVEDEDIKLPSEDEQTEFPSEDEDEQTDLPFFRSLRLSETDNLSDRKNGGKWRWCKIVTISSLLLVILVISCLLVVIIGFGGVASYKNAAAKKRATPTAPGSGGGTTADDGRPTSADADQSGMTSSFRRKRVSEMGVADPFTLARLVLAHVLRSYAALFHGRALMLMATRLFFNYIFSLSVDHDHVLSYPSA